MSALIAIEGISGVGKTTHAKLLEKWLRRNRVSTLLIYEPSASKLGQEIKKAIVECNKTNQKEAVKIEAMLFAVDRLTQYNRLTLPALRDGKVVISDRSVHSSYAYQQARGLSPKIVHTFNRFTPEPDLVIILDVNTNLAIKRLKTKHSKHPEFDAIFDTKNILEQARKNYLKLRDKNPKKFRLIETAESIGETQKKIQQHVDLFLKEKRLLTKKA